MNVNNTKRKRGGDNDNDNSNNNANIEVSWEALLHPNFEELARVYPTTFGQAWRHVEAQRQAAIAQYYHASQQKDNVYLTTTRDKPQPRRPPHTVTALETYVTPDFSLALMRALLHYYWRLNVPALPSSSSDQYLCPAVPNRFFLVHWMLHTLVPRLSCSTNAYFDAANTQQDRYDGETIMGLDIGTGPFAIYALLAAKATSDGRQCHVHATDVDAQAVACAAANVAANPQCEHCITALTVAPSTTQQEQSSFDIATFAGPYRQSVEAMCQRQQQQPGSRLQLTFCLTNPPFFDKDACTANRSRRDGRDRTPMTQTEGWYPNGEVGFLRDLFLDQLLIFLRRTMQPAHHDLPGWTASMCGKKATWSAVVPAIQAILGIAHVDTATFGPGTTTRNATDTQL